MWWRAIAAGASVVVAAVVGVVTTFATQHPSFGLWASLGVLVVLGAVLQALVTGRDHQAQPIPGASSPRIDLAAKDPRLVFGWVRIEAFTGRKWLADQVDKFLRTYPHGYVFIEADAGMGKTTFAAWLVKTRDYPSHFSRYSQGTSVQGALQNLSAQIIRKYRLSDQAPGGLVPEWAQTPGGFQSLLTRAASRVSEQHPLVLVVDGLDEADPGGEGLPFGLPLLLPDKVYVVATYRTGWQPQRRPEPAVTLQIKKDDPQNRSDIREFLTRAAGGPEIAGRLTEANMTPANFVDLLASRCDGVWVYLRYVLEELRLGSRHPDAIPDLPAGLRGYYAEQIGSWKQDPAWNQALLPLLATLGAAGEPLPAATLARLAGNLDLDQVRGWCDLDIRPLLTTTGMGPEEQAYEIYHASFREVLRGDRPAGVDGERTDDALAGELRRATLAAHRRIADAYLELFGGLESGLPVLADDPGAGSVDGGYPLRHLTRHLQQAERSDDVDRLLAVERSIGGSRAVNVWYAAHDYADHIASYLADLQRAGDISADATNLALSQRQPAPALGQEIRYALMAASIASRTNDISAGLLKCAVRAGLWSPGRALDLARRLPSPERRVNAVAAILAYLPADERPGVLAAALADATAITENTRRAFALAALVPDLPADQQPGVLTQALAAAAAIDFDPYRGRVVTALAPYLPADRLAEALDIVFAIRTTGEERGQALTALAPRLSADLLAATLETARATDYEPFRVEALTVLAPHLPAEQQPGVLAQVLTIATAITSDSSRAEALTALAPLLPAGQQPDVLTQALSAAMAINFESSRAEALTALAPLLPPDQQPDVLTQALAAATAIQFDQPRAEALIALAPHLPRDQRSGVLDQALTIATAITNKEDRAKLVAALIPLVPADQQPGVITETLADATTARVFDLRRTEALTTLAPFLNAGQLAEALAAVTAVSDNANRARALTALARYLPDDQQPAVLSEALTAAAALTHWAERSWTLPMLFEHLHPAVQAQAQAAAAAITDDYRRAETLILLAPHLPADRRSGVLAQALSAATAITDDNNRAQLLTALGVYLPPDQRPDVFAQALSAATAIDYEYSRATALTTLARCLPADQQPDVFAQALSAATAIDDDTFRAQALTTLAPHLPADQRQEALEQAMTAAIPAEGFFYTPNLEALVRLLPPALCAGALTSATAMTEEKDRAEALIRLAPYLPADQLAEALTAATAITDDAARARALAALVPFLPADQQQDVLAQALTAATAVAYLSYNSDRAEALTAVAPLLPADQQQGVLAQALTAATAITDARSREEALTALAPHLPIDSLAEALAAAPKTSTGALTAVLERAFTVIPADGGKAFMDLLRAGIAGIDRVVCLDLITVIAPAVAQLGGVVAVQSCADAICSVHRWW